MSGVSWVTGRVDYRHGMVAYFENDGVVWYDAEHGICRDGWQQELEPFEGPVAVGLPFESEQ